MAILVFVLVMTLLALIEFGPAIARWNGRRAVRAGEPSTPTPLVSTVDGGPDAGAERDEVFLTARLLSGDLPPSLYRQGMADLAAEDAERRPLVVPPERDR